jgi:chemotaxis family two-component system response regulator Rcp1
MHILVIEDNPADHELIKEALYRVSPQIMLSVAQKGSEALAFLRSCRKTDLVPLPDLIILDLYLPDQNGREVLREVKQHPKFAAIPVIVFTTSDASEDVFDCHGMRANWYVKKPIDIDEYFDAIKYIAEFWISLYKMRPRRNHPKILEAHRAIADEFLVHGMEKLL